MVERYSEIGPRITVVGGGHGTAALLPEIARHVPYSAAIIAMSDDGGSSHRLIKTVDGINLPVGDFTRVVVATSGNEHIAAMEDMRFGPEAGGLDGHTARNISAMGYYLTYGAKAGLERYRQAMGARANVLPVTFTPHQLVMETDGITVRGQRAIDNYPVTGPFRIWHDPLPDTDPDAEETILNSDAIILGPGSFRGSILAACTEGVKGAIKATPAKKIFVLNAENAANDPDWSIADYVSSLVDHDIHVDCVIAPAEEDRARIRRLGRRPIEHRSRKLADVPVRLIEASVLRAETDTRHDAQAVLREVLGVLATRGRGDYPFTASRTNVGRLESL